ncbi:unnamed protein product [Camellia sinensis]
MLPTVSKGRMPSQVRSNPVFPQYLRRIVKVGLRSLLNQDHIGSRTFSFEFVVWRILTVGTEFLHVELYNGCSYQHTKYHKRLLCATPFLDTDLLKQELKANNSFVKLCSLDFLLELFTHLFLVSETKNQWARDDPAFIVICCLLLAVSTLAYCAAYDHSASHAVFVIIAVLVFHFLLVGVVLATCCWFLTNNYLREEAPNSHVVEQRVEWQVLPFLERTTFFLYPIGIFIILSPILILGGFNPTRYFMNMYFSQRL